MPEEQDMLAMHRATKDLDACVHSKTVPGCVPCQKRLKNQASRFLAERDSLHQQLEELLAAVEEHRGADVKIAAREKLYATAKRIREGEER